MTQAYMFWTSVVVAGAVCGTFLKPRTIGALGGSLFVLCIIGLVISALVGVDTAAWLFGLGAMITPPVAVVSFIAAAIVHALFAIAKPSKSEQRSTKANDR
jgi:hypothetical protein